MSRHHFKRGSTLPEMAIAAVATLSLLFGIIYFGLALYTYGFVAQLAREGARWAIVRGSTSCTNSGNQLAGCDATGTDIQSYVRSLSQGATNPSSISANPTYSNCPSTAKGVQNAPGCTVTVQVRYPFQLSMGFMPSATITMSSSSAMVIAQ
jgi:Flp pilus assembly protein TadG